MVNGQDIAVNNGCNNNFFIITMYVYNKRSVYKKLNFTQEILQHI